MYRLWMPFVSGSRIIKEVNKTELVFHSTVSVPWIATRCVSVSVYSKHPFLPLTYMYMHT